MKIHKISTKAPNDLDKEETKKETIRLHQELNNLHKMMRAEEKHSILVVFQGVDAAGKDGSIVSLYEGLFPMAAQVHCFKAPTKYEASKDYLWRIHQNVPSKGTIGMFNRSHYEDILVPGVHKLADEKTLEKRFGHINDFERMLEDTGTKVVKFYLHISKGEQKERFKERLTNIEKRWKYNSNDLTESKFWDVYMKVYEKIFNKCEIKWDIIPGDNKWYRDYLIAKKMVEVMIELKMKYPKYI